MLLNILENLSLVWKAHFFFCVSVNSWGFERVTEDFFVFEGEKIEGRFFIVFLFCFFRGGVSEKMESSC